MTVSFVAGNQHQGPPTPGPATSSHLFQPADIAFDPAGNLYVADPENCVVEKVTPAGQLSVFVGSTAGCTPRNGVDKYGSLTWWEGNLYIGGSLGYIYRADANGNLTVVAGSGGQGVPGTGPALSQQFTLPMQMTSYAGGIYFGDKGASKVVKLDPVAGQVTVIGGDGGTGTQAQVGLPATQVSIVNPADVAIGKDGSVFVADNDTGTILRIGTDGLIKDTFFHPMPFGLGFDPTGSTLYAASGYGTISRVDTTTGAFTVVAGMPLPKSAREQAGLARQPLTIEVKAGPALETMLGFPFGLEVAANGEIYSSLAMSALVIKLTKAAVPPPPFTGPDTPVVTAAPSVSPSVAPSVSPSAVPTSAAPSVVPSVVPTTPGPVVTSPAPDPANPPQINLNLQLAVDAPLTGARATVSGGGLQPSSPYTLTMYSTPVEVARGTTNAAGAFNAVITMPAKACVRGGAHRLVLTGTAPGGAKLEDSSYVVLDDTCKAKSINNVTAPVNNTVTLQSFTFPRLSAKLRPKAQRTLRDLRGALTSAKAITITGYTETDSKGKAATRANKRLALKRADAVRAHLRKMGITVPISTVGAGGVNGLGQGQKFNRRVVIVVRY
ncbi:hypothetical protein JCM9533A_33010 [Catenuloplanes niger JCM 9533]